MDNKIIVYNSLDRFKNTKYYDLLKRFYLDISFYLKEEQLQSFYNNIQSLKIEKLSTFSPNLGDYSMTDNTIHLPSNIIDSSTIFHELLHMSSCRKNNGIYYDGFYCPLDRQYRGFSLNEGYTELTNIRIFGNDIKYDDAYETEMTIVRLVESLIGKEKLKDIYFSANMKELVYSLIKYNNYPLTREFIDKTDLISKRETSIVRKLKEDKTTEIIKFIVNYLIRSYLYKTSMNYKEGNIDQREAIIFFDNFVNDAFNILKSNLVFKKYIIENTLYDNYDYGKKLLKK